MANPFGLELSWEAIQTALMWARNRVSPAGVQASPTERKEDPLKQQVTSLLPTRDDEAILIALDAAVSKLSDGLNHLARIQQVREALEPHQQTDWRKNLGSLKMTERFEQTVASETVTESNRGGLDADDQGQPQRRRAGGHNQQRRTERKFERRPIDYEWTEKDPRVQHLLLISGLVQATTDGVEKATKYLLSAGFIKKQSASQQAAAAAEQGSKAATRAIHRYVGNVKSTDARLEDIEDEVIRDRYLENRSRQANARREVAAKRWKKYFRRFAIVIILAIVGAALYNDLS